MKEPNLFKGGKLRIWVIKRILRTVLQKSPRLYYRSLQLRGLTSPYATTEDCKIVIEGPPRMGNTFLVEAFKYAQKEKLKIAHHFHRPVQIIRGIQLGLPCVAIIREPEDSCASHAIIIEDDEESLEEALYWYIDFYSALLPYQGKYVVAEFKDVIKRPGKVIDSVNEKYGTHFNSYSETFPEKEIKAEIVKIYSENDTKWFASKKGEVNEMKVSLPSEKRKESKQRHLDTIKASEHLQALLVEAEKLYQKFIHHKN